MAQDLDRTLLASTLQALCEQGVLVTFTYHGGSQPGQPRSAVITSVLVEKGVFKSCGELI